MTYKSVIAFVDWNSQAHAAVEKSNRFTIEGFCRVFDYLGRTIGQVLDESFPHTRHLVDLRLYYGWRRGFEATDGRKAVITAAAATNFSIISRNPNISINPMPALGDSLISARTDRLHPNLNCHLPNTFRRSAKLAGAYEEKMVDTALGADLVHCAHAEPTTFLLVFGEDDDLIPPVIAADGVRGSLKNVILIRSRETDPFFKIGDLTWKPRSRFLT